MDVKPFIPGAAGSHTTSPATVQLHALSAGHFSLPEEQFVKPATVGARTTVPSLCFLMQHHSRATGTITRIVFDLGVRRDTSRYSEPIRRHLATRQPLNTEPDVVASLALGGLSPGDIDLVIYSHLHWDHVGEPRDFPSSVFIVGHGSLDILHGIGSPLRGGHSFFEADLLDPMRTIQLPDPGTGTAGDGAVHAIRSSLASTTPSGISQPWKPLDSLPATLDLFEDGSIYIVDAPGHLPGHINLLVRVNHDRWVYLAGDACHDRRIMRGEKEIGEWLDAEGHTCCIHANQREAGKTIQGIRNLEARGVEVIFAHDVEWEGDSRNQSRFFKASQ